MHDDRLATSRRHRNVALWSAHVCVGPAVLEAHTLLALVALHEHGEIDDRAFL